VSHRSTALKGFTAPIKRSASCFLDITLEGHGATPVAQISQRDSSGNLTQARGIVLLRRLLSEFPAIGLQFKIARLLAYVLRRTGFIVRAPDYLSNSADCARSSIRLLSSVHSEISVSAFCPARVAASISAISNLAVATSALHPKQYLSFIPGS